MKRLWLAYPGDLTTRTGGYEYDRQLIAALGALGWEVEPLPLGPGFPDPAPEGLAEAGRRLSALPEGAVLLIDGLAFGVLDAWARAEAHHYRCFALVHHPLALEGGLSPSDEARLRASERAALAATCGVVVTSPETARVLVADYGVASADIAVALPGTDAAAPARGAAPGEPPMILSVGSLTRRKGHDLLIAALAQVTDLDWRAEIIGDDRLDPGHAAALRAQVAELDLGDRIRLPGAVATVAEHFAGADLFALASRYEGYGMVYAEALARGLPVIGCRTGAVPQVVPEGTGLLVPPEDSGALAGALRRMLADAEFRSSCAHAARRAGQALPGWPDTAARVADFLERNRT